MTEAPFNFTVQPNISSWMREFHPHWWKYGHVIEGAPQWFFNFLGSFFTVVGLIGVLGNSAVVWVFTSTPSLRTPSNVLVINLAACDIVFSILVGFPMSALACFRRFWFWGHVGCQFYSFVAALTGLASINCLAVISVDRYLVVGRPLSMLYRSNFRRSAVNVLVIWSWAAVWASLPVLGWGEYVLEGFGVSCTFDYLTRTPTNVAYNVALFSCCFLFPVVVIVSSYVGIVKVVVQNRKEFESLASDNANRRRQEIKIAKVFAVCILAFVVCWLPYATVAQMGIHGFESFVTPYSAQLPVMFAKTSALWNPIIYGFSHPKYRKIIARSPIFACFAKRFRTQIRDSLPTVVTQNVRTSF